MEKSFYVTGASYDTADSDKRLAPERVSIWCLRARDCAYLCERVHVHAAHAYTYVRAHVYMCVCIKALPVYHGV